MHVCPCSTVAMRSANNAPSPRLPTGRTTWNGCSLARSHPIFFFFFFFSHTSTFQLLDKPWSQVGVVPSPPRFSPSFFIAHRVQQSHCSSIFHRVLLTHALAFYASQFVRKKKSPRIYPSMHSGGFEFTKLTYTRLEDNLIRHRGDRLTYTIYVWPP